MHTPNDATHTRRRWTGLKCSIESSCSRFSKSNERTKQQCAARCIVRTSPSSTRTVFLTARSYADLRASFYQTASREWQVACVPDTCIAAEETSLCPCCMLTRWSWLVVRAAPVAANGREDQRGHKERGANAFWTGSRLAWPDRMLLSNFGFSKSA